jgi:uridine kinase
VHRDRYLVAERLYIEEVDPIRLMDVVIDDSAFDRRRIVTDHRAQR